MTSASNVRSGSNWLRILGIILAIAGLGVAVYMGWAELSGNETSCPGHVEDATGDSGSIIVDCGFVQNSIYAKVFGIPVAILGVLGYIGILGVWLLENRIPVLQEYSNMLVFGMALFGFLFSLYLTYTELFIMYTVCTWCITSAVLMTLIFVISIIELAQSLQTTA